MTVKTVEDIDNHQEVADSRLPSQYASAPGVYPNKWGADQISGWEGTIYSLVGPAQTLEDIMEQVLTERSLSASEGVNLDKIGEIVGVDRQGDSDGDYKDKIVGKIAENNSDGTARDLIEITTILLGDELVRVIIAEDFPAKIRIYVFVNGTDHNPVGLLESLQRAKAAGVGLPSLVRGSETYFGFSSDPSASGFATIGGGGGGNYSTLITGD